MKVCRQQILGFNDTLLMIIGIPLASMLVPLLFLNFSDLTLNNYFFNTYIATIHVTVLWLSFRRLFIHARTKYPDFDDVVKRLLYQLGLVIVSYIILDFLLDYFCEHYLIVGDYQTADYQENHLAVTTGAIILIALLISLYEGIYLYQQLKKSIQEKEQLQRENIQSQLEGLRSQVNPHFLFNSLNTLSYLIPEDADRAVNFVQHLSKAYRYILEIRDRKLISLQEELAFLDAFIFLLKERFEENIQVTINIPSTQLHQQIVPLSLQMLFENAIKHNIISNNKPLLIEVFINDAGKLIVQNNLQQKKQFIASTKVGLQNIKNRYRFFSNETVEVIKTASNFIVALPLIDYK